ncbi:uncharacterized protein LOC107304240 isoform X2 [Oryza brachyantha]|uniref:uncharacterized protein LOC107304240 isoform X2 n=1 Tax=Oryza brachyantha TaxID=4533 RepID=UPI001AD9FBDA|nr:uncharacterized protein LOC107304240 isoform X2 [Oryza brachyantha]
MASTGGRRRSRAGSGIPGRAASSRRQRLQSMIWPLLLGRGSGRRRKQAASGYPVGTRAPIGSEKNGEDRARPAPAPAPVRGKIRGESKARRAMGWRQTELMSSARKIRGESMAELMSLAPQNRSSPLTSSACQDTGECTSYKRIRGGVAQGITSRRAGYATGSRYKLAGQTH